MFKLHPLVAAVIVTVAGCAGQKAGPEPQTAPPSTNVEQQGDESQAAAASDTDIEPEPSDEAGSESSTEASEPTEPEEAEPQAPAQADDEDSPKKSCHGLQKSLCEVTVGCAWSTNKVCVDQ